MQIKQIMQIMQCAAHLTKLWVAKTSQEEPYPIWPMTFPFWNDSIVDLPNVLLMNPRFWVVQHCTKFCWLSQFLLLVNSQFSMEKVTTSWWKVNFLQVKTARLRTGQHWRMADDISLCTLVSDFRGLLGVFLGMLMDVGSLVWCIGIGIYWYVMAYMM